MPKIIVLAHSVGGIVARTSVLLSNHPSARTVRTKENSGSDELECVVSDIIMLSSPNNK